MIEVSGVSKAYRQSSVQALTDVTLAIPEASILGLVGPNGAGKTTLISILMGLVRKDAGTVTIAGHDLDRDIGAARRMCGLAPQDLAFYPTLTVGENLQFYGAVGGLAGPVLQERMRTAADAGQLGEQMHRRAGQLSGGLKRRLNLALSLLHSPRILFLDEPTAGVDPQSRAFILDVVRRLRADGLTVIYTSHYMDEVQQICDHVVMLDHGRVVREGRLADLVQGGRHGLEDLFLQLTQRTLRD